MNKQAAVDAVLAALHSGFESFQRSSRAIRTIGNDAESKSEGKYDTRSTEENYLADGLALQAQALLEAIEIIGKADYESFDPGAGVDLGALVETRFPGETVWFFMLPAGGGIEVRHEGRDLTVITPESPLGAKMMGVRPGTKLAAPEVEVVQIL